MSGQGNQRNFEQQLEQALELAGNFQAAWPVMTPFQKRVIQAFPIGLRPHLTCLMAHDGVEYASAHLWVQIISGTASNLAGVAMRWISAHTRLGSDPRAKYVVIVRDEVMLDTDASSGSRADTWLDSLQVLKPIANDLWEVSDVARVVDAIKRLEAAYACQAHSRDHLYSDRALDAVSLVDEPRMLPPGSYVQVDESERVVTDDPHFDGQGATPTRSSSRRAQTPPDSLKRPKKRSRKNSEAQRAKEEEKRIRALDAYQAGLTAQKFFALMVRGKGAPNE